MSYPIHLPIKGATDTHIPSHIELRLTRHTTVQIVELTYDQALRLYHSLGDVLCNPNSSHSTYTMYPRSDASSSPGHEISTPTG